MTAPVYLTRLLAAALLSTVQNTDAELPFKAWEKAKADAQTIRVEFTVGTVFYGRVIKQTECVLKLRRRAGGEYQVRLDAHETRDRTFKESALLLGRDLYLYPGRTDDSTLKLISKHGDLLDLLRNWTPFILLLDERRALREYRFTHWKQDAYYTYFNVAPRTKDAREWLTSGHLVLMRSGDGPVPKLMPRLIQWNAEGYSTQQFDIKRWEVNPKSGVSDDDFPDAAAVKKWSVREWKIPGFEGLLNPVQPWNQKR